MTVQEIREAALTRAVQGKSTMNYVPIFLGFMEKGIPQHEIVPRENVFTFHAWKAKGRCVKKGEHGVKVVTWIDLPEEERKVCKTTTVFHVSQTEPMR